MPTYTYHCEQCDHEFDQHQSFSEAALKKCPNCKKLALYKVYKPAQVVFKGSGYYVTDSKARSSTLKPAGENDNKNGKSESSGTTESAAKTEKSEKVEKKDSKSTEKGAAKSSKPATVE
jgi:putative FmdB family regulatory protein